MLGFGTQHAIADLDEGTRIVDSPVVNTKTELKKEAKDTKPVEKPAETAVKDEEKPVSNGKAKKPTFKQEEAVTDKEDW